MSEKMETGFGGLKIEREISDKVFSVLIKENGMTLKKLKEKIYKEAMRFGKRTFDDIQDDLYYHNNITAISNKTFAVKYDVMFCTWRHSDYDGFLFREYYGMSEKEEYDADYGESREHREEYPLSQYWKVR